MSGRLLVGLRWWNEVSETGGSEWKVRARAGGSGDGSAARLASSCALSPPPTPPHTHPHPPTHPHTRQFECLEEGQRAVDKKDSWVFWTVLYATPVAWSVLGLVAILKLNLDYLILVVIAVLLSGANLLGYVRCSKSAQSQIRGRFQGLFTQGLRAYMFRGGS